LLIEVASGGANSSSAFSYRCRSDAGANRALADASISSNATTRAHRRARSQCRASSRARSSAAGELLLGDRSSTGLDASMGFLAALGAASAPDADYCFDQIVSRERAST
jgi:hypothetical protein